LFVGRGREVGFTVVVEDDAVDIVLDDDIGVLDRSCLLVLVPVMADVTEAISSVAWCWLKLFSATKTALLWARGER